LGSLVRKTDFKNLIERGKRLKPSSWLLINYNANNLNDVRIGYTIGRKTGPATLRNKLKRWCREWFRKQKDFPHVDINLLFLDTKGQKFFRALKHNELDTVLDNAGTKIRQTFHK
jgi:ribonuclease P protein component